MTAAEYYSTDANANTAAASDLPKPPIDRSAVRGDIELENKGLALLDAAIAGGKIGAILASAIVALNVGLFFLTKPAKE